MADYEVKHDDKKRQPEQEVAKRSSAPLPKKRATSQAPAKKAAGSSSENASSERATGAKVAADDSQRATVMSLLAEAGADEVAEKEHASGIAVAPVLDLGDQVLGTRTVHTLPVFNLDPRLSAQLRVEVVGDEGIQLVEGPSHLRPSRETAGAGAPIRVMFTPERKPSYEARVVIHVGWPMNERSPEVIEVPVTGFAHAPGQPKVAEQRATAAATQEREAAEVVKQKENADLRKKIDQYEQLRVHAHHDGHLRRLEKLGRSYEAAIMSLGNKRQAGVTEADAKIGAFKRMQPVPEQPSLVEQLAWAALDMATRGISKHIAAALKPALEKALSSSVTETFRDAPFPIPATTTITPAPGLFVNVVTDSLQTALQKVGDATKDALQSGKGNHNASGNAAESTDIKAEFISAHANAVWTESPSEAVKVNQALVDMLRVTLLDTNPQAAFAMMQSAIDAVKASYEDATKLQCAATLRHWVRYLAQTSLGTVGAEEARERGLKPTPDGQALTDLGAATLAPDEHRPMRPFDGLIDLQFSIDVNDPKKPAKLVSAKLHGVRAGVAAALAAYPLLEAHVPVRASAIPGTQGPLQAVVPLTITRDEGGNLFYVDNLRLPWEEPRWLSRKAGALRGSDAAQLAGARKLLEQELMSKSIADLLRTKNGLGKIETDAES